MEKSTVATADGTNLEISFLCEEAVKNAHGELGANYTGEETLQLSGWRLLELPVEICYLRVPSRNGYEDEEGNSNGSWKKLCVNGNCLSTLPDDVGELADSLTTLDASFNEITSLPASLNELVNLTTLNLSENKLTELPEEQFGTLANLKHLYASHNQIQVLPGSFCASLTSLESLYLNNNRLLSIPSEVEHLSNLQELAVSQNMLTVLPEQLFRVTTLRSLYANDNSIFGIRPEVGNLVNLEVLNLRHNYLSSVPWELGKLVNLRQLDLQFNHLSHVPQEIGMASNTVMMLWLGGNDLVTPLEVGGLEGVVLTDVDEKPIMLSHKHTSATGTVGVQKYLLQHNWQMKGRGVKRYDREFLLQYERLYLEKPEEMPSHGHILTMDKSTHEGEEEGAAEETTQESGSGSSGSSMQGGRNGGKGRPAQLLKTSTSLSKEDSSGGGGGVYKPPLSRSLADESQGRGSSGFGQLSRSSSPGGAYRPPKRERAMGPSIDDPKYDRSSSNSNNNSNSNSNGNSNNVGSPRVASGRRTGGPRHGGGRKGSSDSFGAGAGGSGGLARLKTSSNGWKARHVGKTPWDDDYDEEDEDTVNIRACRGVLNKLTPENFDRLCDKIMELAFTSLVTLRGTIDIVFDKAIREPKYGPLYSNLCLLMSEKSPEFEAPGGKTRDFRKLMLDKCQEAFERNFSGTHDPKDDPEWGTLSEMEKEEKLTIAKLDMLGNIKFIGELYKQSMLDDRIMSGCITALLSHKDEDEECVEALCKLFTTMGAVYDKAANRENLDKTFGWMKEWSHNSAIPSRIRFMLQDVVELRENHWVPRREENAPTTLEEIKRKSAAEARASNNNARRSSTPNSGRHTPNTSHHGSPRKGGGARGGPRGSLPNTNSPRSSRAHRFKSVDEGAGRRLHASHSVDGGGGGGGGGGGRRSSSKTRRGSGDLRPRKQGGGKEGGTARNQFDLLDGEEEEEEEGNEEEGEEEGEDDGSLDTMPSLELEPGSKGNSSGSGASSSTTTSSSGGSSGGGGGSSKAKKEVLDMDSLKRRCDNVLAEYLSIRDLQEAVLCVEETQGSLEEHAYHANMLAGFVLGVLERKAEAQGYVCDLLGELVKTEQVSKEQLAAGLDLVLADYEDLSIDVPLIKNVMSTLIGTLMCREVLEMDFVTTHLAHLAASNKAAPLAVGILKVVDSNAKSDAQVQQAFGAIQLATLYPDTLDAAAKSSEWREHMQREGLKPMEEEEEEE